MAKRKAEGTFEADVKVRKLRNGHRLQVILEGPWSRVEEKSLIDFRFQNVKVTIETSEDQADLFGDDEPEPEPAK